MRRGEDRVEKGQRFLWEGKGRGRKLRERGGKDVGGAKEGQRGRGREERAGKG